MTDGNLLTSDRLVIGYGRPLLPAISLTFGSGEFWAIIGRNGSGKSTFMKTVLGMNRPLSGRVIKEREDLRLTYIPQVVGLDPFLPQRVIDLVMWGRIRNWGFTNPRRREEDWSLCREAMTEMNVSDLADRVFRDLSEGQKQRVLFARMLAAEAHLAFLDEPTAAMDAVAEREAFSHLRQFSKRHGVTIAVVSHFMGVASECADRVLFLDPDQQAVVLGTPREVMASDAYRRRYDSLDAHIGCGDGAKA